MAALSLDHIGAMVFDLDAGADRWRNLGFTLTRRSPQMGFTGPDGALELWASANHCAVFETGYIELIGIAEPERFNPWARFLDRFEGGHITAFRCENADAAFAELQERAEGLDPPVDRRRMAPFDTDDGEGEKEMRFRNIFSQDDFWPEGRMIVIEHQTPDVLWHAPMLRHANGAKALSQALFHASDVAATAHRLGDLVGADPLFDVDGQATIICPGGGMLIVMNDDRLQIRWPGVEAPGDPCLMGITVEVASLDGLRGCLEANGIAWGLSGEGNPLVLPADANGVAIEFGEAGH